MAYCAISDVQSLLSVTLSVDTTPSKAKAAELIDQFGGMIDVALATGGYVSPATDTKQLAALKAILSQKVAYEVNQVSSGGSGGDESQPYNNWDKRFYDELQLMRDGKWAPADTATTATGSPSGYTDQDPHFTRDKVY